MIRTQEERLLVKPSDIKPSSPDFKVIATINPAAARLPNGDIILYVRIIEKLKKAEDKKYYYSPRMVGKEKFAIKLERFNKKLIEKRHELDFVFKDNTKRLTFISHLRRIILDSSGFRIKSIDQKPSFYGLEWDGELGIEDPRITKINDLYIMTYVSLSVKENIATSYAISNDCIKWYRRGIIFREQNKDVVIFPEQIRKDYVAIDRPEGNFEFSPPHMRISYSNDLEHWSGPHSLTLTEKFFRWDSGRVGAGPPPIKTDLGWLLLYHGVIEHGGNIILKKLRKIFNIEPRLKYVVGALLLELQNPQKILAKAPKPIIWPKQPYEKGTFENKDVVFPTGVVLDKNEKDLLIYSGGGDIVTSVKRISIEGIISELRNIGQH